MKILQINTTANIGAPGRIVENLGLIFMENGWDSYVACRDSKESKSNILIVGNKKDFYNHVIQTRLLDNHAFASISSTEKLIKKIEKINPDVIHLHNLHGYYINISLLFKFLKRFNKQVFWTLYDCWSFTGHCAYFDLVNCQKWKSECNNCPNKLEYPKSLLLDRSRENYLKKKKLFNGLKNMTIIVNSNWLKDQVKDSFLSDYPIQMIHNGININNFKPANGSEKRQSLNLNKKFIILGIANQWTKRKGLADFIRLSRKLTDDEVIVLDGLNEKQRKNLPKNIISLCRATSINELTVLYSMADVFLNPTYEDNFPTTNLESLACGTPVVTYNTGGSPEAIDLNTGFVVSKSDIDSVYLKIKIIKKKGKDTYFNSCLERARLAFNHRVNYKRIIELYK